MGYRKRITNEVLEPVEEDTSAFNKNKCSDNAQLIHTNLDSLEIEIWYDKHYCDRVQHGDDNGKREGIDFDTVKDLVITSIKHLFHYSARVKTFSFVSEDTETGREAKRIILQKNTNGEQTLNVAIECHYISFRKFEITVKTAMKTNEFHYGNGQYLVEIIDKDSSMLFKKDGKTIDTVCSI